MSTIAIEKKYFPFGIVYTGILIFCVVMFYFLVSYRTVPHIGCLFKTITGIPCPTCGATRMSLSFLHLDVVKGLYYNPMLALGLLTIPFWGLHDILVLFGKISPFIIPKQWFRWGVIGVFVLNWVYLIIMKI